MGNASLGVRGTGRLRFLRHGVTAAMLAMLAGTCGSAGAFEIATGNDDVSLNWDNSFRYTYAARLQDQDSAILKSPNFDDGDRNFDKGTIMNRLDLLSSLGLVYKKNYGVRISGATWVDGRYFTGMDNNSPGTSNYTDYHGQQGLGFPKETTDQNKFGAELLDAFAFANFAVAEIPVSVKVGRSTVIWGEGLLNAINAISYSQNPLDFNKATAQPGVEVQEVFRPQNQVYVSVTPVKSLTLAAQYMLQWEEYTQSEAGSYFAAYDFFQRGGRSLILAPGFSIPQGGIIEPKQAGDFGFMARWSPEFLGGATIGAYYRKFSDKQPQAGLLMNGAVPAAYYWSFADNIDLYGLSFGKQIAGTSVGAEISYRTNMPLVSSFGVVNSPAQLPGSGGTFGARGETLHVLVNAMRMLPKTALWDLGVILGEVDYNRVQKVTTRQDLYLGRNDYNGIDKPDKDCVTATLNFIPTWYQVLDGVDINLPLSIGSGLVGNSGVGSGGAKNAGSYGVGIEADIFSKYKASVKYAGFFGDLKSDPTTGEVTSFRGAGIIRDRGFISFTLKATF